MLAPTTPPIVPGIIEMFVCDTQIDPSDSSSTDHEHDMIVDIIRTGHYLESNRATYSGENSSRAPGSPIQIGRCGVASLSRVRFRLKEVSMRSALICIAVTLVFTLASAQEVPYGDQFQINSYIVGRQEAADIAVDDQGNFVVVWVNDKDPSPNWISARLFDDRGAPAGDEFQVNTLIGDQVELPRVAMAADGRFVVVWHDTGGLDGSGYSVRAQRYWATGVPYGGELQINSTTAGVQGWPSVAMRNDGSFLVVWQGNGVSDDYGTNAQGFDWDAVPVWPEFTVNDLTSGDVQYADVSIGDGGLIVVTWGSAATGGNDPDDSIQARCFTWGNAALGPQQQVNAFTSMDQYQSSVAVAPDGRFLVVYNLHYTLGLGGRLFQPDCTPATDEFVVSTTTDGGYWPDVTVDQQGRYVTTWIWQQLKGRMISASGAPLGGEEFLLSLHTDWATGSHPKVAAAPDGRFIATWHSVGSTGNDDDEYSIQARRFAGFIGIFVDTFETGDTTAWTATSP